jgi:hypothetical protein
MLGGRRRALEGCLDAVCQLGLSRGWVALRLCKASFEVLLSLLQGVVCGLASCGGGGAEHGGGDSMHAAFNSTPHLEGQTRRAADHSCCLEGGGGNCWGCGVLVWLIMSGLGPAGTH